MVTVRTIKCFITLLSNIFEQLNKFNKMFYDILFHNENRYWQNKRSFFL